MAWPLALAAVLPLVLGHRIHNLKPEWVQGGEATRLLEAAKARAKRDDEADRAEVLRQIEGCPRLLHLNGEELIRQFVDQIHQIPQLTINFDADRWVKVAEENPEAGNSFNTHVMNLWQVALLPHPPLPQDRVKRDQQHYSYANQRYDTEKWMFGFTKAPEELSSALERPLSSAPELFRADAKNGNALMEVYGYSALFLAPHVWNRSTLVGQDVKIAFADLGRPKDYDATFPKWKRWTIPPPPKASDPILQIPNLTAAGGLPYVGTFENPVAALKLVDCFDFRRWRDRLEGVSSSSGLSYVEVNIFGGIRFAEDVEKVVIHVPTLNSTDSIEALDIDESRGLLHIWKMLKVQQTRQALSQNITMQNSTMCKMWRLAKLRRIPRMSWCLSIGSHCIRKADATSDKSCLS